MILVDANQIMVANILTRVTDDGYDVKSIRRSIFRAFINISMKFKDFGQMVICFDSKKYWRTDIFPYYKANRKSERASSKHNWKEVFRIINDFKTELRNCPFVMMEVDGAESDDIIAVLCFVNNNENHIILSEDKDFLQLHSLGYVQQYDWSKRNEITIEEGYTPEYILRRHIITGDRSDGIPNVLSADDTFVDVNKRQKRMSKEKIDSMALSLLDEETFNHKLSIANWHRNNLLINFEMIPAEVAKSILVCYNKSTQNVMGYNDSFFREHRLLDLIPGGINGRRYYSTYSPKKGPSTQITSRSTNGSHS